MKIAAIFDSLTSASVQEECLDILYLKGVIKNLRLKYYNYDFLFVESSWQGFNDCWKYKIASYPDHPKRNNKDLIRVVNYAKDRGIPTVFWNKEDGVHFDRFIDSARHFDHIFTHYCKYSNVPCAAKISLF